MSVLRIANFFRLVICLVVCFGAAGIGSWFTTPHLPWYRELARPALTPPDWVFGPVWTVLYLLMAIAAFLVWRRVIPPAKVRMALAAFGIQLALNVLWSVVFFGGESLVGGLIVIVVLLLGIAATVGLFARVSIVAALLLAPYLAWVGFATYLNAGLAVLNR